MSIVTAVHDVARYLPDFIASVEAQSYPLRNVELIAVDDGSTDGSLAELQRWRARRPDLVSVLTQPNEGQGSARNRGLDHATGEWVTFADPDDMLDEHYLARVERFLRAHPNVDLVATNRLILDERSGEIVNRHPLRAMFRGKDRLVDLNRAPDRFHGSAPAAFLKRAVLDRNRIRFDPRIRPNFEDGHLCARYLLTAPEPRIGFVPSAKYVYRKRRDDTSTLQVGVMDPRRFTDVARYGYLDVLQRATTGGAKPPEWLQNLILYELGVYFSEDVAMASARSAARGSVAAEFLALLAEIVDHLDPDVIRSFSVRRFDREWADILLHGLNGTAWHTPYAVATAYDANTGQVRLAYQYTGDAPDETIVVDGATVVPTAGKIRVHEYFDHPLLRERIAWVPEAGSLRLLLDGRAVDIRPAWPVRTTTLVRPREMSAWFGTRPGRPPRAGRGPISVRDAAVLRLAKTSVMRRRFRAAWILMDRVHDADDNAEHLFRFLRRERPRVNAWFVIERGSPDWHRIKADGAGRRLLAHGSLRWKVAMLNCEHLISSHADVQVDHPSAIMRLAPISWKFSFLQHGVIKDDLSRWLNGKDLALFVTSTPQEHESIVGDGSNYKFTTKEARMTGLPRFDRLRQVAGEYEPPDRDLLLVCPSWRYWLAKPGSRSTHRRDVVADFESSDYFREWRDFLHSPRLKAMCEANGIRVGFLPHPNFANAVDRFELEPHILPLSFVGGDVQRLVARSVAVVTDFSSMAFNAAYVDRPVVYFQFDADRVLDGAHVGRRGYFDYVRDGFGPVVATVDAAVGAIEVITTTHGRRPAPEFLDRMAATFPNRDGRCCARTADAIESISAPRRKVRHRVAARLRRRVGAALRRYRSGRPLARTPQQP